MLVGDNQIARLKADNVKTESNNQQSTDSHSESGRHNIDVASPNSNEDTSVTEGEQSSGATRTSSRSNKQPERFGEAISTKLHRKEGRMRYIAKIGIYRLEVKLKFR